MTLRKQITMLDTELFRVQTATSGSFYLQEAQVLLTYTDTSKSTFLFLQQFKIKLWLLETNTQI